ncbi:hypothetical protein ACR30L_08305 [Psychromonas sp. PT13]|uniref:hypothetical protein n=1 Tax=Psychromonas sp. PT13 TaxID=3439547 RepID=UPI003EB857E6
MGITIVLIVLILACVIFSHYYQLKRKVRLQKEGLTIILHVKALLGLIQAHRGVSSAWLNGDKSKHASLVVLEQQINEELDYLHQQKTIIENSRWDSFIDHWGRLIKYDAGCDIDNNFHQHTQLIVGLLYLLEDCAEFHCLNAIALPKLPAIGLVWRELVGATESIGQSRGIGAGVATRKRCSSVNKIRLSFLQQNIQKTTNQTLTKLSSLDEFTAKHVDLLNVAQLKMMALSDTIDKELIETDNITINQDVYFALATDCIKAIDNIFELQVQQIEHII